MRIKFWFSIAAMGLLLLGNPAGAEEARTDVSYESLAESGYFAGNRHLFQFSADGRTMVTTSLGDGDDFLDEVWKYDDNRATFLRKPVALPPLGDDRIRGPLQLSRDGSIVFYNIRSRSSDRVVQEIVFDLDQGRVVNSLPVTRSADDISPDNQTIMVGRGGGCEVDLIAIKTGEKNATLKLASDAICLGVEFDPTGRFISSEVVKREEEDRSSKHLIYDLGSRRPLKEFDADYGYFSSDGSFFTYTIRHPTFTHKILDTSTWKEIDLPDDMGGSFVFAPHNKVLTVGFDSYDEYIIKDGRALPVQSKNFSRKEGLEVTYVTPADTWYGFWNGGVITLKTATPEMVQAALNLAEGEKMLSAGFYAPGIGKFREAISLFPLAAGLKPEEFFIDLYERGLPLRYVGELLLMHQQKLLQADKRSVVGYGYEKKEEGLTVNSVNDAGPAAQAGLRVGDVIKAVNGNKVVNSDDLSTRDIPVGSAIAMAVLRDGKEVMLTMNTVAGFVDNYNLYYAVKRLMYYGVFAIHAGHPELAQAAAQEIRGLSQQYPLSLNWKLSIKAAVALEALLKAHQGSVDQAYEYLFEQGGLTHADSKSWANHLTWFPDYWAPLYADRKKLAYLLEMDEAKLPTPRARQFAAQPYSDLSGKMVEPSGPVTPTLEKAPPASAPATPAKGTSQSKGRVLD